MVSNNLNRENVHYRRIDFILAENIGNRGRGVTLRVTFLHIQRKIGLNSLLALNSRDKKDQGKATLYHNPGKTSLVFPHECNWGRPSPVDNPVYSCR